MPFSSVSLRKSLLQRVDTPAVCKMIDFARKIDTANKNVQWSTPGLLRIQDVREKQLDNAVIGGVVVVFIVVFVVTLISMRNRKNDDNEA